jgi:nitric oxide reductase NorD protein
MLDFLELEETVGKAWHRLVGGAATYARYPDHAVALADLGGSLAVMFRGLGGEAGVQISTAVARRSQHRLGWLQRIGLGEEKIDQPRRDGATLFLPERIALFPDPSLNRALYLWLAAWFAVVPVEAIEDRDPLCHDILLLRRAATTIRAVVAAFPGLSADYRRLGAAVALARPVRPMPKSEREVESIVLALLMGADNPPAGLLWDIVQSRSGFVLHAPVGYQPFLPCPLWGDAWLREASPPRKDADETASGKATLPVDTRRRFAVREQADQRRDERDPLALNRFEKILAMAEMVQVNRPQDDDEDDEAEKAADDFEELTVGQRSGKPASRLRFDLDLPPEAVEASPIVAELSYPEWDYRKARLVPDQCRVLAGTAPSEGEAWEPDAEARARIRLVKRRFETLRPRQEILRAQPDGADLDLDALVRARCDIAAGGPGTDRVHLAARPLGRDLAVALLVDVSLSTDAWVAGRRVLDVEKEALLVLAHGLAACGDSHAILTFTSRRRSWVRVDTVKDFDEPLGATVERRIGALKPGYYTRMGTAIRHAASRLAARPTRRKLLLVLTDGKPNDVDHYEGRFGIEDTRMAVREARRGGTTVFGVTIDAKAQSYFPTLFGIGGYAIVDDVARLPAALPRIYREVVR